MIEIKSSQKKEKMKIVKLGKDNDSSYQKKHLDIFNPEFPLPNNTFYKKRQIQKKEFISCNFFEISVGILHTYCFLIFSLLLRTVNRKMNFELYYKCDFLVLLFQEIIALFTYFILYKFSRTFANSIGAISLNDFTNNFYYYITFTLIYLVLKLSELFNEAPSEQLYCFNNLKRFSLIFVFICEYSIIKLKISKVYILSFFICIFSSFFYVLNSLKIIDKKLIIVSIIRNILFASFCYIVFSFRKRYSGSPTKMLIYGSILSIPTCIINFFLTKEKNELKEFLNSKGEPGKILLLLIISSFISIVFQYSFLSSIEKNTSLVTQLLNDSKRNFVNCVEFFSNDSLDKKETTIIGLIMGLFGNVLIFVMHIYENVRLKEKETQEEEPNDNEEDEDDEKDDKEEKEDKKKSKVISIELSKEDFDNNE